MKSLVVERLDVDLGDRTYPIFVGAGLLSDRTWFAPYIDGQQVFVVTSEIVAPLYLDALRDTLSGFDLGVCIIPDGERHKTLATYQRVIDELMTRRHNRTTTLIALGGGVVGDIAGFAAATYQRGVGFLQVPTTLLAQVDSSVGGKTGVNHPGGKNMIGAFHQPRCVVADTSVLGTLPRREYLAGIAEVIKYGVIRDAEFFAWLEVNIADLLDREEAALGYAIGRSCAIKAQIVQADEREAGERAVLNFGHSFGHALEALTRYETYLHGEAVAVGMVMAADLSVRTGWMSDADARRIRELIEAAGLPVRVAGDIAAERMLQAMGMDKKVVDGRLRLVLSHGIGTAEVTDQVAESMLRATLGGGDNLCG
jgi:3-dehydroquinate synthase